MEVDKKLEEKVKNILTSDAGYHRKVLALEQLSDDKYVEYNKYFEKIIEEFLREIDQIVGNYNKSRLSFEVNFSCNSTVNPEWKAVIKIHDDKVGEFGPIEIKFNENRIDHTVNFFVGSDSWLEGNCNSMMQAKGLLSILYGAFLYRINNRKPIGVCPLNFALMKEHYNNFLYLEKKLREIK